MHHSLSVIPDTCGVRLSGPPAHNGLGDVDDEVAHLLKFLNKSNIEDSVEVLSAVVAHICKLGIPQGVAPGVDINFSLDGIVDIGDGGAVGKVVNHRVISPPD